MERFKFLIIALGILLTSCSTSSNVIKDDAYFSPYYQDGKADKELVVSENGTFNTSSISSNSQYDYQAYYSESTIQKKAEPTYEKIETVTDTNGVVYTSTEIYYDDSYKNASDYGYLEDTYDYYYDDDNDDWNTSVYVGLGYPYGTTIGFAYGYPYYNPYYYPSYYYNWHYNWWWNPYYYYPHYHYPHYYYPLYPPHKPGHGGHKPHPGGGLAPAPSKPRPNEQGGLHVTGTTSRPVSAGLAPSSTSRPSSVSRDKDRPSSMTRPSSASRPSSSSAIRPSSSSRPSNSSTIKSSSSSSERKSYAPASSNRQVRSSSEYVRPSSSSSSKSSSISRPSSSSSSRSSSISRPSSSSSSRSSGSFNTGSSSRSSGSSVGGARVGSGRR